MQKHCRPHRRSRCVGANRVRWVCADHDEASGEVGFEEMYRSAGVDLGAIPWVAQTAHPALLEWLDRQPQIAGMATLVVGCGVGDDAEELARRGAVVTAFDVSPTAISWCFDRFPSSSVDYVVADLFHAPSGWSRAFGLVIEIRTLQSLPPALRGQAVAAIAETVAPGGRLFVRCAGREESEPLGQRPWPVSRRELGWFSDAGLQEVDFEESVVDHGRSRVFTASYHRPALETPR